MLEIGHFFGINTDLRIDPISIPDTVHGFLLNMKVLPEKMLTSPWLRSLSDS